MSAYYNEFDPKAAAWLRALIAEGHLPPGDVDERSIEDVRAEDLAGYAQCHFFAGIGGWPYALCRAGWSDERPVWTGSCPCQPLSSAGNRKGHADERHLWPAFHRLIAECAPAILFGEQVASRDGREWFAAVRADLEAMGYACGAADLCSAGAGAPHIRQRLFFGAGGLDHAPGERCAQAGAGQPGKPEGRRGGSELGCGSGGLADRAGDGWGEERPLGGGCRAGDGKEGRAAGHGPSGDPGGRGVCGPGQGDGPGDGAALKRPARLCADGGLAHTDGGHTGQGREFGGGEHRCLASDGGALRGGDRGPRAEPARAAPWPGAVHGGWSDADWLLCRDAKWRPVESGTFPLADGLPARVVRLRGYGNAIVPQVAAGFVTAFDAALRDAGMAA